MTAHDDLAQIENSTDWNSLIEKALADPPNPHELLQRLNKWATVFSIVYGREPLEPDFPQEMKRFFRLLATAHFPADLRDWVDTFEQKNRRLPRADELPTTMQSLLPKSDKPKGPPRCDTKKMRNAARAWQSAVATGSYRARRETIEQIGKTGCAETCFGFNQVDMLEMPSTLARLKLSEEWDKSEEYIRDLTRSKK